MGHRTLLAYAREGGYDLHRAHWGVDPDTLEEAPFGGAADDEWARKRAAELLEATGGELTDEATTAVDPDPLACGLSFSEICERVDPIEHEALYVVDGDVRTYLVAAVVGDPTRSGVGALIGYDGPEDAAYLRGWLAGARAVGDVHTLDPAAIARALRWLDPTRGVVVWIPREDGGRSK